MWEDIINFLRRLKDKIYNLVIGEELVETKAKREEKAEYLVPLDARTIQYLPKWAQEEIAAWRARARALEEEVEDLKKELEKYKKVIESEELREIARLKKALEEFEAYNKFFIILKPENEILPKSWDGKPIYTRVKISGKEVPVCINKVVGLIIGDSDYGPTVQLLCQGTILEKPYNKTLIKLDLGLLEQLPYMIYDFRNLLTYLKKGEIILNVDSMGRRIPYALTVRVPQPQQEDSNNEQSNSKYVILEEYRDLLNQYPDLRDAIISLYEKVNELSSENADLKAELEEWKDKYSKVYAELNALKKIIETNRAQTVKAISELGESYKAIADAVGTNLQLSMRLNALEVSYFDLMDRYEELLRKYIDKATMIPEEAGEMMADKVADKLKEKIPLDILELGIRRAEEKKARKKDTEKEIEEEMFKE